MNAYPDGRAHVTDGCLQIHHKPCDVFENFMKFVIPRLMLLKMNGIVKAALWNHLFKGDRINDYNYNYNYNYNLSLTWKQAIQKAKEKNHA